MDGHEASLPFRAADTGVPKEVNTSTGLKKSRLPDPVFCSRYSFSPYKGCRHACVYCEGRAERYYVEGDFAGDIEVRVNLPGLLGRQLAGLREPGIVFVGSGVSDAYQPMERETGLMRRCALALAESDKCVSILTKSSLVNRDLDIWKAVNERSGVILVMSIVFPDDELRAVFEPGASSIEERFETLRRFRRHGISTGVCAMPMLPFFCDREERIHRLFGRLRDIGVDFVSIGDLTLRPGRQKDLFFSVIAERFPGYVAKYRHLYRSQRKSGSVDSSYGRAFYTKVEALAAGYGFPRQVPHRIYKGRFALYDELYVLLHHMVGLYSSRSVDVGRLRACVRIYASWLDEEKRSFNRRRKRHYSSLEQKLRYMIETGEMAAMLRNERLARFIERVVIGRETFDYLGLSFVS